MGYLNNNNNNNSEQQRRDSRKVTPYETQCDDVVVVGRSSSMGDEAEEVEEYFKEYEKKHAYKNKVLLNERWHYTRTKVKLKRKKKKKKKKEEPEDRKFLLLKDIQKDVRRMVDGVTEQQKNSNINSEWRILAKVLDRLFFGVFLLTVAVSACAILGPAYYAYR